MTILAFMSSPILVLEKQMHPINLVLFTSVHFFDLLMDKVHPISSKLTKGKTKRTV